MKHLLNTKLAGAMLIVLLSLTVVAGLVVRWQQRPAEPSYGNKGTTGEVMPGEETGALGESTPRLDAWRRPSTTDPKAFAVAYATAIWTYDTEVHDYFTWQDAVSVFADPMDRETVRVARSLLPHVEQFSQLKLHGAKAAVSGSTADVTPELEALGRDPRAPAGWHGYRVRATQNSIVDGSTTKAPRQATVAVVCQPQCKFWSASTEAPQ